MENLSINIVEDKSVQKLIEKNKHKLEHKYSRHKSNLNETKLLKNDNKAVQIFSYFLVIITTILTLFSVVVCVGTIYTSYYMAAPTFFGVSTMQIASGSMSSNTITIDGAEYESGFNIGDTIIVRSVDTSTLKIGDKIAFYVYTPNYMNFYSVSKEELVVPRETQTRYSMSFGQFFGFQTKEINDAAINGGMLTFHHITNIYRDSNGKLWFKTQGSANVNKDTWFVSEEMVVGIYSGARASSAIAGFIELLYSDWGFILFLLLPVGLLCFMLIRIFVKDLQLALLELDVVEEKRKLTDKVCVKNHIGYMMDTRTKYKVLAQATEDEKMYYLSLLWKDGSAPYALKKYVLRKRHILAPTKKLLLLNRECEKMYNEGKPIEEISKHYTQERELIEQEILSNMRRIRRMRNAFYKHKKEINE